MKPIYHVAISGGVTAIFSIWVKSTGALVACFLSGFLIDLDHHVDYWLARKELPLSYKKLVDFCDNDTGPTLRIYLHSHEFIILFWICIFYFSLGEVWLGMAIGFTTHILCDEIANPFRPLSYFLIYRIKHGFERKKLFKEGFFDDKT